jgi:hypothetical protein
MVPTEGFQVGAKIRGSRKNRPSLHTRDPGRDVSKRPTKNIEQFDFDVRAYNDASTTIFL